MALERFKAAPLPNPPAAYDPQYVRQLIRVIEIYFNQLDSLNQTTVVDLDSAILSAGNAEQKAVEAMDEVVQLRDNIVKQFNYGSFYDTTDQTAALINTAYGMTFNTTELSYGVTIGSPTSRVYVDRANVYNIQFSAQFINTGGGANRVWIWLRKNGTDVTQSATVIRIQGNNTENVAAWNFLLQLNAGDYFELMWEVDSTDVSLHADPATAIHPAVPSIILTVTDNVSSLEV